MISFQRLETILNGFPKLRIGLVGDLFLDRYLEIDPELRETSIETGRPAHQVVAVRNAPGALGTVMSNLAALGVGTLVPLTVIGDDGHGDDLMRQLAALPVDPAHVLRRQDRLTPTYTKPVELVDGQPHELDRLDVRTRAPLTRDATDAVCRRVPAVMQATDGLIVLDQVDRADQGVVNNAVREALRSGSAPKDGTPLATKPVIVDSRAQLSRFEFGILKGNAAEVEAAAGDLGPVPPDQHAAVTLAERRQTTVVQTLGGDGIVVAHADGRWLQRPAPPVSGPIDIVGAGDSVTSGLFAARLAGATWEEAAEIANLVASITITQLGQTGTATPEQLLARSGQ